MMEKPRANNRLKGLACGFLYLCALGLYTALAPSQLVVSVVEPAEGQTTYNLQVIFKRGTPDTSVSKWGAAITGLGDVSGDGYDDVGIVGYSSTLGARVYLFGGSSAFDTIPDWISDDATAGPGSGLALCGGDINGDGYSDIILEAAGKVYVYYGKPGWPNTTRDLRFLGRMYEGASNLACGDLNGDDTTDLIVSDFWNMSGSGHVLVYRGSTAFDTMPWLRINGHDYEQLGSGLASGADINGDGIQDLVVGAQTYNADGRGRVYLFHGGLAMDTIPDWWKDGTPGQQNYGSEWRTKVVKVDNGYCKIWTGERWYPTGYPIPPGPINGLVLLFDGGNPMDSIPDMTIIGRDTLSSLGSSTTSCLADSGGICDLLAGSYGEGSELDYGKGYLWLTQYTQDTVTDAWIIGRWLGDKLGVGLADAGDVDNNGKDEMMFASYDTNQVVVICKYTGPDGVTEKPFETFDIQSLKLFQNSPNPFCQYTMINYQLPMDGKVSLKIYNIAGQLVKTLVNDDRKTGKYEVHWDGKDEKGQRVSNGIYFYHLTTEGHRMTGKMQFIR